MVASPEPVAAEPGAPGLLVWRDPVIRAATLITAVLIVLFALDLPGERSRAIIGWTGSVVCLLGAAGAAYDVAARLRGHRARRFWLALAGATGSIGLGNAIQLVTVVRGIAPDVATQLVPSAHLVGTLGALTLIVVMLADRVMIGPKRARLIFGLDMATVMAATVAVGAFCATVVTAAVHQGAWRPLAALVAGPALWLVLVFSVIKLLLSGRAPFSLLPGLLGVAASTMLAVNTSLAHVLSSPGQQHWYFVLDAFANLCTLSCARAQQLEVTVTSDLPVTRRRSYSPIPYVAVAVAYALMIISLTEYGLHPGAWAMVGSVTVCTGLVIARQLISFADNHELLIERRSLTARLEQLAYRDSLTGLANRAWFFQHLEQALETGRGDRDVATAVILIDLDDFKPINDAFGHHAGDEVLIGVAGRLNAAVGCEAVVARLGGDEFAVALTSTGQAHLDAVVQQVSAAIESPIVLDDTIVTVGCSVGVATETGGGVSPADLVRRADIAMYSAKAERKAGRKNELENERTLARTMAPAADRPPPPRTPVTGP